MSYVKILSLILLSVFLILTALADFTGFHLSSMTQFVLGLIAATSGVLMLLSIKEFCHHHTEIK